MTGRENLLLGVLVPAALVAIVVSGLVSADGTTPAEDVRLCSFFLLPGRPGCFGGLSRIMCGPDGGEAPSPPGGAEFERLKKEAEENYRAGRFEKAAEVAGKMIESMEKAGGKDAAEHDRAVRLLKRATVFDRLVGKIVRSRLATHKGVYRLTLAGGAVHYGRVISHETDYIEYEKEDGIVARIPSHLVVKKEPVTPEDYERYLRKRLAEKEKEVGEGDYVKMYAHVVVFARRYGLDGELPRLLERIFGMRGAPILAKMVLGDETNPYEQVARLLEGLGRDDEAKMWREAGERAKEDSDAARKTDPLTGLTPPERRDVGEVERIEKEAGPLISRAVGEYGKERFRIGRRVLESLRKAQRILNRLIEEHPDNEYLDGKQRSITDMIGFVQKVLTGFGR